MKKKKVSIISIILSKINFNKADLFISVGMSSLFYGLSLKEPWIAYTVTGSITFLMGISNGFIKGKN